MSRFEEIKEILSDKIPARYLLQRPIGATQDYLDVKKVIEEVDWLVEKLEKCDKYIQATIDSSDLNSASAYRFAKELLSEIREE